MNQATTDVHGPDALGQRFYRRADAADMIMHLAHFPDEVLPFLQMECLVTREVVWRYDRDAVVELGCYDGRALEVARLADIGYLGVDTNADAISALDRRIDTERMTSWAGGVVASALDVESWCATVPGSRPVYVLPFNLVGNFDAPDDLLARIARHEGLAVISAFNQDVRTTKIRHAYYTRCGVADLHLSDDQYNLTFAGGSGFQSRSFTEAQVGRLVRECGASVLRVDHNAVGFCVTAAMPGGR